MKNIWTLGKIYLGVLEDARSNASLEGLLEVEIGCLGIRADLK